MVVDACPGNAFPRILLLLQFKNVPNKELLQLLVGKIDAQLLKADGKQNLANVTKHLTEKYAKVPQELVQKPVVIEVLKAKDVE